MVEEPSGFTSLSAWHERSRLKSNISLLQTAYMVQVSTEHVTSAVNSKTHEIGGVVCIIEIDQFRQSIHSSCLWSSLQCF